MDDAQFLRRQEHRRRVQEWLADRQRVQLMFARFGGDTCRVIWEELRRHQGLAPLLQRLGLPAAATLDEEFDLLLRFLAEQGPTVFLRLVRPNHQAHDWDLLAAAHGSPATGAGAPDPSPRRAAPDETPRPAPPPAVLPPETLGPRAVTPPEWFDAQGRYIGPERRTGPPDRRSGKDRRQSIDPISRNKRFGGERRKSHGRRATDRR